MSEDTDKPTMPTNPPYSTLEIANETIRQQEYLLNRQYELMQAAVMQNQKLVRAANRCERENHKLKKELEGYKSGKLWTIIASLLPNITFGGDRNYTH